MVTVFYVLEWYMCFLCSVFVVVLAFLVSLVFVYIYIYIVCFVLSMFLFVCLFVVYNF